MRLPRMRTLVSVGLLACATAALVPLGCGSRIVYPAQEDDRPRIPDATAERLRECVDELGGELGRGYYTFDVAVKVDEDGHVVEVESKGVPHEELAICMRIALRGMTVPEELLGLPKLRLSESSAPANGQTAAERGLVGHPGALVAVVVVLADLIVEAAPLVVVIAASLELSGEIAEVARKKDDDEEPRTCRQHLTACLLTDLADEPGNNWSTRRCPTCFQQCDDRKAPGNWPTQIKLTKGYGSCEYWELKWKR